MNLETERAVEQEPQPHSRGPASCPLQDGPLSRHFLPRATSPYLPHSRRHRGAPPSSPGPPSPGLTHRYCRWDRPANASSSITEKELDVKRLARKLDRNFSKVAAPYLTR